MRRRGFTLIEVITASVIAGLVLVAAMSIMGTMTKTDEALAKRHVHEQEFERLRMAVERALNTLVMSDGPIDPEAIPSLDDPVDRVPYGTNEEGIYSPGKRPRVMLEVDQTGRLVELDRRARQSAPDGSTRPQRFELYLRAHPVTVQTSAGRSSDLASAGARGAFELRSPPGGEQQWAEGMELWWVPLGADGMPAPLPSRRARAGEELVWESEIGRPVRLATGLTECRWRAFYNRVRQREHAALWAMDLPAYIELRVKTTSGLAADWLFEVGWTTGPEAGFETESLDDDDGDGEGDDARPPDDGRLPGEGENPSGGGGERSS